MLLKEILHRCDLPHRDSHRRGSNRRCLEHSARGNKVPVKNNCGKAAVGEQPLRIAVDPHVLDQSISGSVS